MNLPDHLIELMLGGLIGLVVFVFRNATERAREEFKQYKDEQEQKWKEHKEETLRREGKEEERRREDRELFAKLFGQAMEHSSKVLEEIWNDLREFKVDRRRYDEEMWKQVNALKDRQGAFELNQVTGYHTKAELVQLFNDRLNPIYQSLTDIKAQLGGQKRQADRN